MSEPRYCSYAGGMCQFANVNDCPKQSVLKHCDVLKAANKESRNDANKPERAAVNTAP